MPKRENDTDIKMQIWRTLYFLELVLGWNCGFPTSIQAAVSPVGWGQQAAEKVRTESEFGKGWIGRGY